MMNLITLPYRMLKAEYWEYSYKERQEFKIIAIYYSLLFIIILITIFI